MKIPQDYLRRVYAGWLGKVIGIRLGAPIEGWSYEMIRNTFGELNGYPASYKNFAADDDSNGPLSTVFSGGEAMGSPQSIPPISTLGTAFRPQGAGA